MNTYNSWALALIRLEINTTEGIPKKDRLEICEYTKELEEDEYMTDDYLLEEINILKKRIKRLKGEKVDERAPNTIGEWIEALKLLDPNLPLFVRCKYTGEVSWTEDYPVFTKGLNEMEAGAVGYPHATILY